MRPRHGFTLHEMLITLGVMSGIVALAVQVAVGQLRFFRGEGEIAALRGQLAHATDVAAGVLWSASPGAGDILVASDSAIELRAQIGTAVTCASGTGQVTIPAPSTAGGNTLSAFIDAPDADDFVAAYLEDSAGGSWLTLRAAAAPVAGGCISFTESPAWTIPLREQLPVPAGTALRILRPLRLSVYRASDGRWYLGARDWNAATQRFNTIQPVAGPLSELRFAYADRFGGELAPGAETSRIASVRIVARGVSLRPVRVPGRRPTTTGAFADSAAVIVVLRNAR
jgi:prepilin-type N-terminal cleavage/methylation domain-containing protein